MIEKIVLDYLNKAVSAHMEMPEEYPGGSFVIIQKTGGGGVGKINHATFALQSYGDTLYEAAALNERLKALMENIVALDEISRVSLNSDYNFTDPATKRYRYQAVYDIVHY